MTLISVSLSFVAAPIGYHAVGPQAIQCPHPEYRIPGWVIYLLPLAGALGAVITMHVARGRGRPHAAFARFMLVKG